jgi:large subunit ribosomal protein L31
MKEAIHPDYVDSVVVCNCGNTFKTRSTKKELHTEICSDCHPFFSGKQKIIDSAGRVERFQKRYGNWKEKAAEQRRKVAEAQKKEMEAAKAREEAKLKGVDQLQANVVSKPKPKQAAEKSSAQE